MAGTIEIAMTNNGYGGDWEFDSTGDLVLAIDTPTSAAATNQRLARLMFTRPRITNDLTGLPTEPDDLFNPDDGAGIEMFVHQNMNPNNADLENVISGRILPAVQKDPGVASSPPPILTFTYGNQRMFVTLEYQPISGQRQTVGPIPLAISGA